MADLGPDLLVEKRRLENQRRDILGNVTKNKIRLAEILAAKAANLARAAANNAELEETIRRNQDEAEFQNIKLDAEVARIEANEEAAQKSVKEIDDALKTMTAGKEAASA